MDQMVEMLNLIKTVKTYVESGRMTCEQVPVDAILSFVESEYNSVNLNHETATEVFENMLRVAIDNNNATLLCLILDCLVQEDEILTALNNAQKGRKAI